MSVLDLQSEKRRLRVEMRARLASVTPERAQSAGCAIALRLADLGAWQRAMRVALFVSLPDELDTTPLIRGVLASGKELLLPRMTDDGRIDLVVVDSTERLVRGRYGILEPPRSWPATGPVAADLVCVPGLAFDRSGGRLGRGGGYYDRTFNAFRGDPGRSKMMGIGFSFQLVASVPMTGDDVRLDGVVTDAETIELRAGRGGRANEPGDED